MMPCLWWTAPAVSDKRASRISPGRLAQFLLPPDVDLATVTARLSDPIYQELAEHWNVTPIPPPTTWQNGSLRTAWPPDRICVDGRDVGIYELDTFWPLEDARVLSVGCLRKWRLARVAVPLVRFNPARGRLEKLRNGTLVLDFVQTKQRLVTSELNDRIGRGLCSRYGDELRRICRCLRWWCCAANVTWLRHNHSTGDLQQHPRNWATS